MIKGSSGSVKGPSVENLQDTKIHVAQQILSTHNTENVADRWLFDTGADVDATNSRDNLVPGTVVELKRRQFSIQTGGGVVFESCMGQVKLSLRGPKGEKKPLTLKYVVCINELPLDIISGKRFYRGGGRLEGDKLVSSSGIKITNIDSERRGFFLWLYGKPEPLKNQNILNKTRKEVASIKTASKPYKGGDLFQISDEVQKKLTLWHRSLCHPSTDRLKWTIRNTMGIDLNVSDVEYLPCEACDMGKSLKFTTNERRPRMNYVGEDWHYDVGSISPVTMEGYAYFCLTTEDVSRFRILYSLKRNQRCCCGPKINPHQG